MKIEQLPNEIRGVTAKGILSDITIYGDTKEDAIERFKKMNINIQN